MFPIIVVVLLVIIALVFFSKIGKNSYPAGSRVVWMEKTIMKQHWIY